MKKLQISLIALGLILGISACQPKEKDNVTCPSIGDAEKVEGLITKVQAQEMLDLYIKNQYAAINQSLQREDNLEIYFPLEKLKNYIAYLEKQSETAEHPISGVRVYFGAKESEGGESTVFFYPTYTLEDRQSEAAILNMQESGTEIINSSDAQGLDFGMAGKPPKRKI